MASKQVRSTVHPKSLFDPKGDAEVLRKAMKGLGTDEKAIIDILAKRTTDQRLEIASEYKTAYGKDLVSNLKSELTGKFEDVIVALMTPLPQFYAKEMHDAIAGIGTDEDALIEMLCTLSNNGIRVVADSYEEMYKKTLETDLKGDTSGSFRKLCVSLVQGNRDESNTIDKTAAHSDAQKLFDAGVKHWGTDDSVFNQILVTRSYQQLKEIFKEYQKIAGHDISSAIKKEFSGDVQKAFLAIVKILESKTGYFAAKLNYAMLGMGTNDKTLIRIVVSRAEIDLGNIKDAYELDFGKPLVDAIKDDTSGDYRKLLVAIVGE